MWLNELIAAIPTPDESAMSAARKRQASLTKPAGSLGRLEDLAIRIAGIRGEPLPILRHKAVLTLAGDHGVVAEGVSAYPQEVTAQMLANFQRGGAAVNVLAKMIGARLVVADLGAAGDVAAGTRIVRRKTARGTENMTRRAAMSAEQALRALKAGADLAAAESERGLDVLALGEMGIGNTTSAAAIAAVFTRRDPADLIGRGTGIDENGLARKIDAARRAIDTNKPDADDPLDVLAKLGGFELAGLAGAALAAASRRCPILIDGYPATAAVMIAQALAPRLQPFLIASHLSRENGHQIMLDRLGLRPLLDLEMRLGEGTGAVLGLFLADAACRLMAEMATFDEAGIAGRVEP